MISKNVSVFRILVKKRFKGNVIGINRFFLRVRIISDLQFAECN
jgi:hypothetical protein